MSGIKITDKDLLEKLTGESGFGIFDDDVGFRWEPSDFAVALLNSDFVGLSSGTVLTLSNFQDFLVFTGGATFSATLPTAVGNDGQTIKAYAKLGESGTYTLATTGGQTIDGVATRSVAVGECVQLVAISGQWYTISSGVLSVNGKTGYVILNPDDLDDAASAHKFISASDLLKLSGIEASATADQSDAEIKTAYENNANTNEFNDSEKTKLGTVETGATADQSDSEIKIAYENNANTNGYTDAEQAKLASIDATHYGPPLQSTTQLSALTEASITDKERRYVEDEISDYFYDQTAVSGDIAPDDQTGGTGFWRQVLASEESAASIKAKYESNANTNVFNDAEQSKLSGIESGATADQTNSQIETAYNAQVAAASEAEMIAGTQGAIRRMSPLRVKQAIDASGGGGLAATTSTDLQETVSVGISTVGTYHVNVVATYRDDGDDSYDTHVGLCVVVNGSISHQLTNSSTSTRTNRFSMSGANVRWTAIPSVIYSGNILIVATKVS